MKPSWTPKQLWTRSGKDFSIEISRHQRPAPHQDEPEYFWCLYVYIYPQHPLFDRIQSERISEDSVCAMPFHIGCTFNSWYFKGDGKIASKKIGCDYNHLYDDRFLRYQTESDAYEVFNDANYLYEWMELPR